MSIRGRADQRRKRIVGNIAANFEEADKWDLEFWQKQTPQARLSALMSIREDIAKINKIKKRFRRCMHPRGKGPDHE